MILADILQISINLILIAVIVVCILLLGIILMQRPKQEGLGAAFGSALTDQAFGARTTDVLQKGTVYLGSLFMILSFVLSLLYVHQQEKNKLAIKTDEPAVSETTGTEAAGEKATISPEELLKKLEEANQALAPEAVETPETPTPAGNTPAGESVTPEPAPTAPQPAPVAEEPAPAPAE